MHTVFRTCLLATAASLTLMACKDNAASDIDAVESLSVKGLSDGDIAKHFEVGTCEATDAQMQAGLVALGLDAPTDDMAWDGMETEGGGYEFDGVSFTSDGKAATIGELDLACLREVDGVVMVDRVSADDISITSDEGTITIASLSVVEPDAETVRALLDGNTDIGLPKARAFAMDDLAVNMTDVRETTSFDMSEPPEVSPDSDFVKTVKIETVRTVIALDSLAFASAMSADARDGFIRMGELDMTADSDTGEDLSVDFDGVTVTGIVSPDMFGDGLGAIGSQAMGPFATPYDTMEVGDYTVSFDTMELSGGGIVGENTRRGKTTDMVSVLEPATLSFSGPPNGSDLAPVYAAISGMGYDSVTVSGRSDATYDEASDRMVSKGGFFEWEDGFRLVIDNDVTGFGAVRDATVEGGDPSAALENIKVNSMAIRLDDNSIVDRIFTAVAAEQDSTPKMLRMQAKGLLAMSTMGASGLGIDPELVSESVSALGEFIDSPNSTLVLELAPGGPLGMNDLMASTKDEMGFTARVEK